MCYLHNIHHLDQFTLFALLYGYSPESPLHLRSRLQEAEPGLQGRLKWQHRLAHLLKLRNGTHDLTRSCAHMADTQQARTSNCSMFAQCFGNMRAMAAWLQININMIRIAMTGLFIARLVGVAGALPRVPRHDTGVIRGNKNGDEHS